MFRIAPTLALLAAIPLALSTVGCGPSAAPPPVVEKGHGDHDHSADMEKMKAELAKLSPEDAASAEKQHICPVSDEMLGSMGPPKKIDVKGKQVWICCDACREALVTDPDKYLAKLKNE